MSSRKSKKGNNGERNWEEEIVNSQINDDTWSCIIALFNESSIDYHGFIEHFVLGCETCMRRRVRAITMQHIINKVKKPQDFFKKMQNKGKVRSQEKDDIYQEAQRMDHLDAPMLARLIKYEILQMKDKNKIESETNIKMKIEKLKEMREIVPLSCQDIYGGVNKTQKKEEPKKKNKEPNKEINKSQTKSSKNNNIVEVSPIYTSNKYRTSLLTRDQVGLDQTEIEDYPYNSYDFYIGLCHFYDPDLPIELLKIGVPISAIVKVSCLYDEEFVKKHEGMRRDDFQAQIIDKINTDIFIFWKHIKEEYKTTNNIKYFKDCALMKFQGLPCFSDIFTVTTEPDKKIYEKISHALYDIGDFCRWHKNYFRHMKIIKIPKVEKSIPLGSVYLSQMESIPMESESIETILNIMLNQIEDNIKKQQNINQIRKKEKEEVSNQIQIQKLIENRFKLLNELYNIDDSIEDSNSEPMAILYHDIALYRTWYFDKPKLILSWLMVLTLALMPWTHLWHHVGSPTSGDQAKNKWHLSRIQNYLSNQNHSMFIYLMQFLIGNKLECPLDKSVLEKTYDNPTVSGYFWPGIKTSPPKPWLIPGKLPQFQDLSNANLMDSLDFLFTIPEFVDLTTYREANIRYPIFYEELTPNTLLQFLAKCWQKYNCAHYYYFPLTDSIIIKMHSGINEKRVFFDRWASNINTVLHFGDFFTYVLQEDYAWFEEQEEIYNEQIAYEQNQEYIKNLNEQINLELASEVNKNAGDLIFSDEDLILKGSIKDMIRNENKFVNDESSSIDINPKLNNLPSPVKTIKPEKIFDIEVATKDEPFYKIGFDIGSLRTQRNGKLYEYFSPDGCKIKIEINEWLRSQIEETHLSINKCENILHLNLFRTEKQLYMDFPIHFHIETKDGIFLGFAQKNNNEECEEEEARCSISNDEEGFTEKDQPLKQYYDFRMSWPTGLYLQINETSNPGTFNDPYTISQRYLQRPKSPHFNSINTESWRVYTKSGHVYRFLQNSSIQILCPNGTILNCHTFYNDLDLKENFLKDLDNLQIKEDLNKKTENKKKLIDPFETRPYHSLPIIPPMSPIRDKLNFKSQKVDKYTVIDPDGRTYEKRRANIIGPITKLLLRKTSNFHKNEQFFRRGDGTDIRLWGDNNSMLEIMYPDGTRITSWYSIEEEEIFIDLNEDMDEDSKSVDDSNISSYTCENEIIEGFVSVLYHCRIENPCFAGVYFNGEKFTTEIFSNPSHKLKVLLNPNLDISYIDFDETHMRITSDEIIFCHSSISFNDLDYPLNGCASCETKISLKSLNLEKSIFCENRDTSDQVFHFCNNGKFTFIQCDDEEEQNTCHIQTNSEDDNNLDNNSIYHYLIMNRNLTGAAFFTDREVMNHLHELWHLKETVILESEDSILTLKPIVEDWSQSWLLPYRPNNKITSTKNSSYCMHLFAPHGNKSRPTSSDFELTPRQPELFHARFLTICDQTFIQDLLHSIELFFSEGLMQLERLQHPQTSKQKSEAGILVKQIRDAILGQGPWNLMSLYAEAVRMPRPGYRPPKVATKTKFIEDFLVQRAKNRELEDWYREALRRQAVPPYFKSIPGSTFLAVLDMINQAIDTAEQRNDQVSVLINYEENMHFVVSCLELLIDQICLNESCDEREEEQFLKVIEMFNAYLNILIVKFMSFSQDSEKTDSSLDTSEIEINL